MLLLPMPDRRFPPVPPPRPPPAGGFEGARGGARDPRREAEWTSRARPDRPEGEDESEDPPQGITRFEDMNPRELQLAIAYGVQETKIETRRIGRVQKEHTDQIGALTTEQEKMARTQQRHRERLDTLESQRPPISVPPHAGDLSQSGRHIIVPVDTAMEQQIEFQTMKRKAGFVDWMTRGSGTVFVSLVTAGIMFLVVWVTRALTLAAGRK
jgi:hypothetical protein